MKACRANSKLLWVALALVGLVPSCHLFAGDITQQSASTDPNATGGSTSTGGSVGGNGGLSSGTTGPSSACPTPGANRCTGAILEVCESGSFRPQAECASAAQCDATNGRCLDCVAGDNRCTGWRLETCAASQVDWSLREECETTELCDQSVDHCLECLSGDAFCNGAQLYQCNATRTGWDIRNCGEARLCNARAQDCIKCVEGEYQCNSASLQRCDAAGDWQEVDICGSPQLCQVTLANQADNPAGFTGTCQEPGCTAGTYKCDPVDKAKLLGCPPNLVSWEVVDTCLTAALCNAVAGKCDAGCQPGTYQCNADRLEQCKQDGTGYQVVKTCASAAYCNATKRDCVPCLEGEFQCSGVNLQKCNANQTWATQAVCASAALCNAKGGACTTPTCAAGAFQCAHGTELQQCTADRTGWFSVDNCVVAALCDNVNGRCNTPECEVGATRCYQNSYQTCDTTTRKWVTPTGGACTTAQLCTTSGTSHCLTGCPTPARQCSGTNGNTLESCSLVVDPTTGNNKATWTFVATCPTAALCNVSSATCLAPTCDVGQYQCTTAGALQVCNAGRNGWTTVKTCATGTTCDAVGKQCDICKAGTFSCVGAQLHQCSSDGQADTATNCDSAGLCYASGTTGYCSYCSSGEKQCQAGTSLSSCTQTSTGAWNWGTATACGTSVCQDNAGNADYCAACPVVGEVQCVTTASPGSTRTCAADRSAWSTAATCAKGYGCIDNGTADYCADACSPNQIACVSATSTHTCAADGSKWGATVSECADASSLKACSAGVLSGKVACPADTPHCVDGACVACTGSGTTCKDADTSQTCVSGSWVPTECTLATPVCATSTGACAACTVAQTTPSCSGNTRNYCTTANTQGTEDCAATGKICSGGACVECTSLTAPSCTTGEVRKYCSNNQFVTEDCAASGKFCDAGLCVACTALMVSTCSGAIRTYCESNSIKTEDCSLNGGSCVAGACVECASTMTPTCSTVGEVRTYCANNQLTTEDCAATGRSCAGGMCVACTAAMTPTCSGSIRTYCASNQIVTEDCAATGKSCASGACVECTSSMTPTCSATGEVRTYCSGNSLTLEDCAVSGKLCSAGVCVQCRTTADCADGLVCDAAGQCGTATTVTP